MGNPVRQEAVLKYNAFSKDKVSIRVTDQSGKIVQLKLVTVEAGTNQLLLNTSLL